LKRSNRTFLLLGLVIVFAVAWIVVLTAKSPAQKQSELIEQAEDYMKDEIYVLAAPLLIEAAGYNGPRKLEAENMLKTAYLQMIDQSGIRRDYIDLLDKQMRRSDAGVDIFVEAAQFYLAEAKYEEAFAVLNDGIAKTKSEELVTLYENNRYAYYMGFSFFDDVTMSVGATIGVRRGDFWGIATSGGSMIVRCEYDKVSTFSNGRAIVKKGGVIYAIDRNGNRLALLKENASDFGNYANDRIPILLDGKRYRANGELARGANAFDWVGTYREGYAAAQQSGKWGVVDISTNWLIPAEYDGVIMDELGRSYARGAVFVKQGNSVNLYLEGVSTGEAYDDARPFSNEGYAAVKRNGKWGFINLSGEVKIDFQFDDALSFGQHLAAVKQGDFWGYISLSGKIVIEPEFLGAKSFAGGSAPVLTEGGWRFITLYENRTTGGGL